MSHKKPLSNGISINSLTNEHNMLIFRFAEVITGTEHFWSNTWNRIVDISGILFTLQLYVILTPILN